MKNYAKAILYGYPLLKTVEQDYEEHIKNKAVLSYFSPQGAEGLAEYLAEEIIEMRKLEWLKGKVEEVLRKLTDLERVLVGIRYFGKRKADGNCAWTERTYFRKQQRLGDKITGLLTQHGLTEEVFLNEYANIQPFQKISKKLEDGKDKKISARERSWISG